MNNHQNRYEELFSQMLNQMNISLIKYGKNAYTMETEEYIMDFSGEVFQNVDEVFGRLEEFIDDMFRGDLNREAADYGLIDFQGTTWDEILESVARYRCGTTKERQFVQDHEWEIEVLDMLVNHLDDVDINNLVSYQSDKQVFYVEVTEKYHKLVRVIASEPDEACEKAMDALNCGDIECSEYLEDSTTVEVEDKEELEEFWCTSVEDVTLIDENGEVVE